MLDEAYLSNISARRFDFGVPLEDIFPENDVHPRLKYLFHKAFQSYSENAFNIEHILIYEQGSLNECLSLKDSLIFDRNYSTNIGGQSPGTYFWLIRHFMGLLPLPLFPEFTNGIHFDWNLLANECKLVFKACDHTDRNNLDYEIAQSLHSLPILNVILINALIKFIRKICMRKVIKQHKFNKNSLIALSKYFYSSLFVRPYRPGHLQKNEYNVLLLYLILRWHNITQHCYSFGLRIHFLDLQLDDRKCLKDFKIQTHLKPDVITICHNIPFVCNKYLKDSACQTETDLSEENNNNIGKVSGNEEEIKNNFTDLYTLAYIEEELDEECESENNTFYQTAYDISFKNTLDDEKNYDWKKIIKETKQTVKKVEESYFYDDYETFKNEDYNQIGNLQASRTGSFLSKIGRYSFKNCSTPKKVSPESENSYIKYPDVCDSDNGSQNGLNNKENNCNPKEIKTADNKTKVSIAQKLFHTNNSSQSEEDEDSKQNLNDKNVKKNTRRKYLLKRIRLSLEFLRALTPKKSTFQMIESRVKYQRMKLGKSYTI